MKEVYHTIWHEMGCKASVHLLGVVKHSKYDEILDDPIFDQTY